MEEGAVPHFVDALGLDLWAEGSVTYGRAEIHPGMLVPGTTRPRVGVLATMVDLVAGSQPTGPINPTVDLRVEVLDAPAMSTVRLACEVLRAGRTLFVGRTSLYADDAEVPFARSLVTFMNRRIEPWDGQVPQPGPVRPDDERIDPVALLGARFDGDHHAEIDALPRLSNGTGGTVQGGVLALLAELVSERALSVGGRFAVTDLDIRYLNRVRSGPVRATAEVLPSPEVPAQRAVAGTGAGTGPENGSVAVRLTDDGGDGRLVAFAFAGAQRG